MSMVSPDISSPGRKSRPQQWWRVPGAVVLTFVLVLMNAIVLCTLIRTEWKVDALATATVALSAVAVRAVFLLLGPYEGGWLLIQMVTVLLPFAASILALFGFPQALVYFLALGGVVVAVVVNIRELGSKQKSIDGR
jgi:hypothetical protein